MPTVGGTGGNRAATEHGRYLTGGIAFPPVPLSVEFDFGIDYPAASRSYLYTRDDYIAVRQKFVSSIRQAFVYSGQFMA